MPSLQIVNIQQVGLESPYEKNTTVWASVRQSGSSSQGKKVSDLRFGVGHRRTPRNNFC